MRKTEGLRLLQEHFGPLCVDCIFISSPHELRLVNLDPQPGRIWRVRAGHRTGSEVSLPQGSFYSIEQVIEFIERQHGEDPNFEFVIHRVDADYFSPLYVGTLALLDLPHPHMRIDLQAVMPELVSSIDTGKRPRDWEVTCTLTYNFLVPPPIIQTSTVATVNWEWFKRPLYQLWRMGRDMDELSHCRHEYHETFTRFNIYASGRVLLDDHRSSESFTGIQRG